MASDFDDLLIGDSPELRAVVNAARIVAEVDVTVLVHGESGTGKELLARAIHGSSRRSRAPMATINCAALPEQLIESELFGHRRGAFTGATGDQPGRIRNAAGGTLFLDEIGEMPLASQAKLLRFLETGECQAIGQPKPERVDVRVVAATNRDLLAEVREGRFREDLYYRLHVVPLELPPLRERRGDVPILIEHLTRALARQHGLPPPIYQTDALQILARYHWPGNVRELRNFCERTLILLKGQAVHASNLPRQFTERSGGAAAGGYALPDQGVHLETFEVDLIRQALQKTQGNRTRAAQLLGLSRDTLQYRLKKYAIA
ncbi:sigma54 specific transcriptional regulator, Fis family ZraR - like protein [Thioalkalivibrio nitratireducens DSM 14787]|uniref:Sigma54 specific transcriptional regulator, Fis family ZraR-like protein n=1 Tax=Thioalkalivibrio nitratireducens (strain DSM 14787 / UNIQEM 213 / ALEN2) TaxID=1255043 RepID=L0DXV7_THIND|nr:sigma 54-interacting transcriptional regulator [Thioalkalivibrio nitratireducens]AGA34404.1 sigma54 specific transcriptional regulator, Fis family ZraR - like protein [Thioalkalivibrio nitratireducens DSM 14787]